MMDYPHRIRLKLLGHARVLDAREHPELVDQLAPESLRSKVASGGVKIVKIGRFENRCRRE